MKCCIGCGAWMTPGGGCEDEEGIDAAIDCEIPTALFFSFCAFT